MWLLVITFMQIHSKEKQTDQKEILQRLRRKRTLGSVMDYISAQGDKKFEMKPDVKWNKGSDDLKARPHPAKHTV